MPKITFMPDNVTVDAPAGKTLLEVAMANGIEVRNECGGHGMCTTCRCIVQKGRENLSELNEKEKEKLGAKVLMNYRLSCQAVVNGDVTVFVARSTRLD
jgi:2Fe-2S ferredoxin